MPSALNLTGIAATQEQWKLKTQAQKLAQEVLAPNAARIDRDGEFPSENIKALGEAGLLGLTIPEELGGPGHSIQTTAYVIEQLAQGCASTAMAYTMHMSAFPLIAALVNEEQTKKFLEPVIRGEHLYSVAMTESGSGNRLWHMDSHAVQDGDEYIIDSFKSFATSCGYSDYFLVPVRANSEVGPDDLSLFIIDANGENVKPIGEWDGMGLRGNSSRPVHFDKCRVPASHRLGDPTCGFSMMF
ncbi:MAG TPA: acyl-CoA dehydrogenase family protein, partial [bacterium]|nr:acyl-CoA dehydrogenase family protein [bacterium]